VQLSPTLAQQPFVRNIRDEGVVEDHPTLAGLDNAVDELAVHEQINQTVNSVVG
jgi:hypothetical protein